MVASKFDAMSTTLTPDEWHSHKDELNRKVSEQLAHYVHLHLVEGELSAEQFRLVCDCLYCTTSGLIDWSISNLIARTMKDLEI